jgi:hypothetical protein
MGAWGVDAFDNDSANDWAYGLNDVDDLSLIESAIDDIVEDEEDYLDADLATDALAACEVLARLLGNAGKHNAFTEKVNAWVAAHPLKPPATLIRRAHKAIDRIAGDESELHELWSESGDAAWLASVNDLRSRLRM